MGMYHATYVAYGVRIDHLTDKNNYDLTEDLDKALKGTNCSHLSAGNYDQDMVFLVIKDDGLASTEVELGMYETLHVDTLLLPQYEAWNEQLTQVLAVVGITPDADPAWIVVPDLS